MVFSYGVIEVAYNSHTTPIFKELGILQINDYTKFNYISYTIEI